MLLPFATGKGYSLGCGRDAEVENNERALSSSGPQALVSGAAMDWLGPFSSADTANCSIGTPANNQKYLDADLGQF